MSKFSNFTIHKKQIKHVRKIQNEMWDNIIATNDLELRPLKFIIYTNVFYEEFLEKVIKV